MLRRRRFAPDGRGRFRVQLRVSERQLLGRLPTEALALVDVDNPAGRRLFPVAYPQDEVAEAEYKLTVGSELVRSRRAALQTLAETAGQPSIDHGELEQWLIALETLRLLLGTQLDVTEDMALPHTGDPRAVPVALYHYLSGLQDDAVQTLSALLPPGTDDDLPDGDDWGGPDTGWAGPGGSWPGGVPDHPPGSGPDTGWAGPGGSWPGGVPDHPPGPDAGDPGKER